MKTLKRILFLQILVFVTFISAAQAQQSSSGKLGLLWGYSVPDSENVNPHQMYGVTGMAHLIPTFSFGGYYLIANKAEGSGGRTFDYSLHGIQALYHILAGRGDTFIGLRAGLSKVRTEESGEDLIFSPYHHGIVSGYDFYLTSWATAGFEGSFLLFRTSETTNNNTVYSEKSFKAISFMGSLKVNF